MALSTDVQDFIKIMVTHTIEQLVNKNPLATPMACHLPSQAICIYIYIYICIGGRNALPSPSGDMGAEVSGPAYGANEADEATIGQHHKRVTHTPKGQCVLATALQCQRVMFSRCVHGGHTHDNGESIAMQHYEEASS